MGLNSTNGVGGAQSARIDSPENRIYNISYMPNGSSYKKASLDKNDLKKYHIDIWKRFSSPVYPTVVTTNAYHVIRDKNTANFYI